MKKNEKTEPLPQETIEEFRIESGKVAHLIFEMAEANNINHIQMAHAASFYIRAICLANNVPYEHFVIMIDAMKETYQEGFE